MAKKVLMPIIIDDDDEQLYAVQRVVCAQKNILHVEGLSVVGFSVTGN